MYKLTLTLLAVFLSSCSTEPYTNTPKSIVRIATATEPTSLDPRYVHDTSTVTILHMLYEGLMSVNSSGEVVKAIAEKVDVSDDFKTYTFTLRDSKWSNGDPLTAADFVATWTSLLDPKKASPNAYQLYPIKGAKEFHQGKADASSLGLSAPNPKTLIVELADVTPYFLELVATYFYYPVHPAETIGNGPFKLDRWKHNDSLQVSKNPHYWDAYQVILDSIEVCIVDENTALHMFHNDELDWAGSPMSEIPQDAIAHLHQAKQLHFSPAAGTHWLRFNTHEPPFVNQKMRQAFSFAINRKEIVEHITQGGQRPATAIVPPFTSPSQSFFQDHDITKAWTLFQEALVEMRTEKESLPDITFCYKAGDRAHKIAQAIQQQWAKAFDITIKLEACEGKHYFERVSKGDFIVSSGSWYADFADPINFLEIFKYKSNAANNTHWENEHYITLLDASSKENDPDKRKALLESAEEIIMDEMPVAPTFFGEFNYVKKRSLQGVYVSPLGYLDFKQASYVELIGI